MGVETNIGWTHHTFNMWRSCVEVAPECANCYARELAKQNPKILGKWGKDGTRVVGAESYWYQPIRWNAAAKAAVVTRPRRTSSGSSTSVPGI